MHAPASPSALSRLWRALPVVVILALATVYVLTVSAGILGAVTAAEFWVIVTALVGQAALLAARYRWPLAVLLGVIVLDWPMLMIWHGEVTVGSAAVMMAMYTVRRTSPASRAYLWAAAGALATAAVMYITLGASDELLAEWRLPAAAGQAVATFALPLVIAEVVLVQTRLATVLRERAELAERDRERNAREAVQLERNLIARELHDIAAHHLTGIILTNQAARALLKRDPDQVSGYLDTIQTEARTALENVRQTVGLLRTDGETDLAPAPALSDLPQLIAEYRERGLAIEFAETGERVALGPIAGISAYRTVQESLANAAKHAPGSACAVTVEWGGGDTVAGLPSLRISVTNTQATRAAAIETSLIPAGGNGLIGMRERAALTGGTLVAGPRVDGGWAVELTIPAESSP
ncbi:sensor histidine kinase [Leucobacter exalbidus]|nr:histidine kinase [Leucobacter exalbidus]